MTILTGNYKTTKLIDISEKTGFYIVCMGQGEASRIHSISVEKGKNIPFPLTFDEFLSYQYSPRGVKGVLIDNVGMLISYISNVTVHTVTLNSSHIIKGD